jgi:dipeptidase E
MKLLITSAGITNKSLVSELKKLVKGKMKIAFIPTAANTSGEEKDWLVKNYDECMALGEIYITDIAAVGKDTWLPILQKANVIVMGGGDSDYLMKQIIKSGLRDELPALLKDRVYVGISAGGIVTNKKLSAASKFLYDDEKKDSPPGLGYVDFYVRPHLNSPSFPKVRDTNLRELAKQFDNDLYAIDDNSGILCINGKIKVISEGKWVKY